MVATTDFFMPRSVDEAVALLGEHGPDLTVLGGGTIIMGMANEGMLFPKRVMSLARAGMGGMAAQNGHIAIGGAATLAALARQDDLPLLAQAAGLIGGPALRTTATIGGNLFAPTPNGDLGAPLLALDAAVELAGPQGHRTITLEQFYTERAQGASGELVTGIRAPRAGGRTAYIKQMRRRANAPAVVAVAVRVVTGDDGVCTDARIALGAAALHPIRAREAEAALVGRVPGAEVIAAAAEAAMAACDPPTDALASAWYRRRMVGVQVRRALERATGAN
jgi:CO/xanthine dehydrogenase FAD-binding subunit